MTATDEEKTTNEVSSSPIFGQQVEEKTSDIQTEETFASDEGFLGIPDLFDETINDTKKSQQFIKLAEKTETYTHACLVDDTITDIASLFEDNGEDFQSGLFEDENFDAGDIDRLFTLTPSTNTTLQIKGSRSSSGNCGRSKNETRACKNLRKHEDIVLSDSDSDLDFDLFSDDNDRCDTWNKGKQSSKSVNDTLSSSKQNKKTVQQKTKTNKYTKVKVKAKVDKKVTQLDQRDFYNANVLSKMNNFIMGISESKIMSSSQSAVHSEEDTCCICMDSHNEPKVLPLCSHKFCSECIDQQFKIKPVCPVCFTSYGVVTGNQPNGTMNYHLEDVKLPGYESYNAIVIDYGFPNGIQTIEHPNPGVSYTGTSRRAYLPNSPEGQKVLKLLEESFRRKLTFTVGRSRTTGMDNTVTWNDVHHKTSTCGGMPAFGYPDPTYLSRVQEELAAKGVTEQSLADTAQFRSTT